MPSLSIRLVHSIIKQFKLCLTICTHENESFAFDRFTRLEYLKSSDSDSGKNEEQLTSKLIQLGMLEVNLLIIIFYPSPHIYAQRGYVNFNVDI